MKVKVGSGLADYHQNKTVDSLLEKGGFASVFSPQLQMHFYYFLGLLVITKYHKMGGQKQQKCIVWQFWKLEVQNQGVNRAMFPLKPTGENPSSSLLALDFSGTPYSYL